MGESRINVVLDDDLMAEASELTGIRNEKELIHEALRSLIAMKNRKKLSELRGQIRFVSGYNYKALRSAE